MIETHTFGILPPMAGIGTRIRQVRKTHRLSQEAFARALGVSRGAVGNWELDEPISRQNLSAIAEKWHVSLNWLAEGKGDAPHPSDNLPQKTIVDDVTGPVPLSPKRLSYGGTVGAGGFLAVDEYFNQDADNIPVPPWVVPNPAYPHLEQFAWMVEGDSMNELGILEGMWAVAARYMDYVDKVGELYNGQVVIVERSRHGKTEIERTIKEVQFTRGGMYLVPRSTNERHRQLFVPLDHEPKDQDEEIVILAVVLSAVRDFSRPPR